MSKGRVNKVEYKGTIFLSKKKLWQYLCTLNPDHTSYTRFIVKLTQGYSYDAAIIKDTQSNQRKQVSRFGGTNVNLTQEQETKNNIKRVVAKARANNTIKQEQFIEQSVSEIIKQLRG